MQILLISTIGNESFVALYDNTEVKKIKKWKSDRNSNRIFEAISEICQNEILDKIGVITGPGGFTQSRVGVTVANAIAKIKKIPIVGIAEDLDLDDFIKETLTQEGEDIASVFYAYAPHITKPKNKF